jgi:hypothetical protein
MKRIFHAMQVYSIEVFLAFLCLISGLPILLNPAVFAPTSILALLPIPVVVLWAIALTLGGTLNLLGIATGNVYMRRAGLALLAGGSLIMGVSVIAITGLTRLLVAGIYVAFSWATGARYRELGKELKLRRLRWKSRIEEN